MSNNKPSLSDIQIEYLCKTFIISYSDNDRKSVFKVLLKNGECIVGSHFEFFKGGLGNFAKEEAVDAAVDCKKIVFDREAFLSSKWLEGCLKADKGSWEAKVEFARNQLTIAKNTQKELMSLLDTFQ